MSGYRIDSSFWHCGIVIGVALGSELDEHCIASGCLDSLFAGRILKALARSEQHIMYMDIDRVLREIIDYYATVCSSSLCQCTS